MSISKRMLFVAQQGKCFYCGRFLSVWRVDSGNPMGWTHDHFFPKSSYKDNKQLMAMGGHINKNAVLSCQPCNSHKKAKMPTEQQKKKHQRLYTLLSKC